MSVLDASALLAFLQGEPGASEVEDALLEGASCSTANWSEVCQKVRQRGGSWPTAASILATYDLRLEPVTPRDAEKAAELWDLHPSLSLGDRLCLALAFRREEAALTTDRAWRTVSAARVIR